MGTQIARFLETIPQSGIFAIDNSKINQNEYEKLLKSSKAKPNTACQCVIEQISWAVETKLKRSKSSITSFD